MSRSIPQVTKIFSIVALLGAYVVWLSRPLAPYAGSADSSGYLWSARLLRHGSISMSPRVPEGFPLDRVGVAALAPLGTTIRPGTRDLVPTYPTGLPLHIAVASLVLEEERAVRIVLLAIAAGAVLLCYLLGREAGLDVLGAVVAGALLALSPLFLFLAVQPMSDVLATLWAEAAVLSACRARRRQGYAIAAGLSLGVAVLVRPTNIVLAVPVVLALPAGMHAFGRLVVGGLPAAAFLLAYQASAYGSPLASGYGDVSSAFALTNVLPSLVHYVTWLPRLASWLLVLAPVGFWAWRAEHSRWRLVMGSWMLVVLGVYAFYVHTSETWWYLRFVLPAFPPLVVTSVRGLDASAALVARSTLPRRADFVRIALVTMVAAAMLALLAREPTFREHRAIRPDEHLYQDVLKWIALYTPPDTPVLMVQLTGAANYYAPRLPVLRFDRITPGAWDAVRAWQRQSGRSVRAALYPFEIQQMFPGGRPLLPCNWQPRGHYRRVAFWECAP